MNYELDIKANALDSFNEALEKFEQGEKGDNKAYKFAILHTSHFLELILKIYIISVDENLVFSKCYRHITKISKDKNISILESFEKLKQESFDLRTLINNDNSPHTITLDQALEFAKCEKCKTTEISFIDTDFCIDIEWIKGLRNNIEHFQFKLEPKEVRLCIGRLVRGAIEFLEIFDIMDLESEIGKDRLHIFKVLADEYTQLLREAKREVVEQKTDTFRGVRPKHYAFIEWNVYTCPDCSNHTMTPNQDSSTGYRCTYCKNEDSDEIEVQCDSCGAFLPRNEMDTWHMDDETIELRCCFCSGQYQAEKYD
ncbi:hypothetical protein [Pseudomonas sp. TUM22785]|uniref:hypothetical protein n=1 Tax=Pseudomonas sp. TUM22785 TaxID=3019098 RepID=UPI002304DBCF|nr:hypothetical protein [Pseudomonas sp. TUM22785]WCD82905.1 hypothetical protein PI990_13050 [Pseudomonas sp. TUM22785]